MTAKERKGPHMWGGFGERQKEGPTNLGSPLAAISSFSTPWIRLGDRRLTAGREGGMNQSPESLGL